MLGGLLEGWISRTRLGGASGSRYRQPAAASRSSMSLTAWLLSWYSTAWIPARRAPSTRPGVVEEHHLRWLAPEPLASQGVDPGVGLAHPALVGVDDLVDEVFEP